MEIHEKDIEDWVVSNVEKVWPNSELLARQMQTGSGRLDLLVYQGPDPQVPEFGNRVVVAEIKRERITASAVGQVSRYMNDLDPILPSLWSELGRVGRSDVVPDLEGHLLGCSIGEDAAEIVTASRDMEYFRFRPTLNLEISHSGAEMEDQFDRPDIYEIGGIGPVVERALKAFGRTNGDDCLTAGRGEQ